MVNVPVLSEQIAVALPRGRFQMEYQVMKMKMKIKVMNQLHYPSSHRHPSDAQDCYLSSFSAKMYKKNVGKN